MDEIFKLNESHLHKIYNKLYDNLNMEYLLLEGKREKHGEFLELHKSVRDEYNTSQGVLFGGEYKDGKYFGVDLPIFIYEGTANYVPLFLSDDYLREQYNPEKYAGYLSKIYFWEYLADKNIWERDVVTGMIQRKKKTFYTRDIVDRITPVIIEDDNGNLLEGVFQNLKDKNSDKNLIFTNERAAFLNKHSGSIFEPRLHLR